MEQIKKKPPERTDKTGTLNKKYKKKKVFSLFMKVDFFQFLGHKKWSYVQIPSRAKIDSED